VPDAPLLRRDVWLNARACNGGFVRWRINNNGVANIYYYAMRLFEIDCAFFLKRLLYRAGMRLFEIWSRSRSLACSFYFKRVTE